MYLTTILVVTVQTALNYLSYAQHNLLNSDESKFKQNISDPTTTIIPWGLDSQTPTCHWTTALLTVSLFRQRLHLRMTWVSRSGARSPLKCYSDTATWWRYIDCDTVRGYLSCYTRSDLGMVWHVDMWSSSDMTWTGTWRCPRAAPRGRCSFSSTSVRPRCVSVRGQTSRLN